MASLTRHQVLADADAELLAACTIFEGLELQSRATFKHEDGDFSLHQALRDRLEASQEPYLKQILSLRATSLAAHQAKARCIAADNPELLRSGSADIGELLVMSLVHDLLREQA